MKTYTLTLTEDEAHALGYTIRKELRTMREVLEQYRDAVATDRIARLESAYSKLDASEEREAPESASNAGDLAVLALKHAADVAHGNVEPIRAEYFEKLAVMAGKAPQF